jgi:hypothetical protein
MKNKLALLILAVLIAAVIAGAQRTPTDTTIPPSHARYRLLDAHADGGLFLLDTYHGRVWRYQPAGPATPGGKVDMEFFVPVGIGTPFVYPGNAGMMNSADETEKLTRQ